MAAIPVPVLQLRLNGAEPLLRALVHLALIDAGEKAFNRLIPERGGVGEDDINFPIPGRQYPLYLFFDRRGRLLVRPPGPAMSEAVVLIDPA